MKGFFFFKRNFVVFFVIGFCFLFKGVHLFFLQKVSKGVCCFLQGLFFLRSSFFSAGFLVFFDGFSFQRFLFFKWFSQNQGF